MALGAAPERVLFLAMIGAPYESDTTTTLLRMADAAVAARHRVSVWTCGFATTLTLATLGDSKPRNLLSWDERFPSTAALVTALLDAAAGRLEWLVCRYCMEERGATAQIDGVAVRPPYEFVDRLLAADASLVMGLK